MIRRFVRAYHQVPDVGLKRGDRIPGLLSARGVETAWFDYQTSLVNDINALLKANPGYEGCEDMYSLVTQTQIGTDADSRKLAALASQAYSNEFFFRNIRPSVNLDAKVGPDSVGPGSASLASPDISTAVANAPANPEFAERLAQSFDSLVSLRELLVNRGAGMFGNGSVWLIEAGTRLLAVNTYNWATPVSHEDLFADEASEFAGMASDNARVTGFAPLMCLNAWQHVYLHDYGVAGKRAYLRNLMDCIDWDVVATRLQPKRY